MLHAARRHWWLIVICIALAGGAAYVLAERRATNYEATAQILVTPLGGESSYTGLPVLITSVDPTRTLQTAASILDSAAVAARVSDELPEGFQVNASEVSESVEVAPLGDSDIVSVVARRSDAAQAQSLADRYATAALDLRAEQLRSAVQSSVADLRRRQDGLASGTAVADDVARELTDLQRILDGQDPNFSLLNAAGPADRVGISRAVLFALAAVAGAMLGLLGALVLERLNRRVRDEDELLDLYPLPVLARIPSMSAAERRASRPDEVPVAVREAIRGLQVQLDDGRAGPLTVMFTSPSPGDGKTTMSTNFAFAAAATGAQVVLLDFDLRKSDVGGRLGLQTDLMDLYRPGARLEDLLIDVPSAPGMRVLSARADAGVAPLFEAVMRRIPEFIAQAEQLADYVVVDTAPLGAVSDALRVATAVDAIVLVARPGHTHRDDVVKSREVLERLRQRPTGLVVVAAHGTTRPATYGYGVSIAPTAGDVPVGRRSDPA